MTLFDYVKLQAEDIKFLCEIPQFTKTQTLMKAQMNAAHLGQKAR